jgi:hypothetical protein
MQRVPAEDKVLALSGIAPSTLTTELAAFTAGLQKAVAGMNADDVSFELDASGDRLRVRLRAYKHRNGG